MRIIPAIDIIDGKCVRLSKGAYETKKIYNDNPLEVAKRFEAAGIEYLHLVDLDGARTGSIVNYGILEALASKTQLKIDFGGGLKSDKDLAIAFDCGASKITGGSIAVKDPNLFQQWLIKFGSARIILGADVVEEKIAISGWLETTDRNIVPFLDSNIRLGVEEVICTDISRDGMLEGPSFNLYEKILGHFPNLKLTASGGVSDVSELARLEATGCEGVIIGKAIYEGRITLRQLEKYIIKS